MTMIEELWDGNEPCLILRDFYGDEPGDQRYNCHRRCGDCMRDYVRSCFAEEMKSAMNSSYGRDAMNGRTTCAFEPAVIMEDHMEIVVYPHDYDLYDYSEMIVGVIRALARYRRKLEGECDRENLRND